MGDAYRDFKTREMIVEIKQTILIKMFYKTEIVINGWATFRVYGPFHYHRAKNLVNACELKFLEVIQDEKIKDTRNVIYNDDYSLQENRDGKNPLPKSLQ